MSLFIKSGVQTTFSGVPPNETNEDKPFRSFRSILQIFGAMSTCANYILSNAFLLHFQPTLISSLLPTPVLLSRLNRWTVFGISNSWGVVTKSPGGSSNHPGTWPDCILHQWAKNHKEYQYLTVPEYTVNPCKSCSNSDSFRVDLWSRQNQGKGILLAISSTFPKALMATLPSLPSYTMLNMQSPRSCQIWSSSFAFSSAWCGKDGTFDCHRLDLVGP